jgi:ribose transport system permease protein
MAPPPAAHGMIDRLRARGFRLSTGASLLIGFVLISAVFSILSPYFLSGDNFLNIARTMPIVGIVAIGETLVLISGGVDLSVGSVAALTGVVTGLLWEKAGWPIGFAVLAGLGVAALAGAANGFLVARVKINAFISTLATFSIVRGLAFVLTNAQMNQLTHPNFLFLGRGQVLGIPFPFILVLVLYAIFYVIMRSTPFGRDLYAIGGNPMAARLAGIPAQRRLFAVFVLSAVLAGLGGLVQSAQLAAGTPQLATGLEFTVIAAVVLGGTSLSGGKGSLVGTLLGVLILRTLDNGLILVNLSSYWQQVARGSVLILAVGIDVLRSRLSSRRRPR